MLTGLLVVSGLAEGVGFFSLVPMLELAAGEGEQSGLSQMVARIFALVGLTPTLLSMVIFVTLAMVVKAGFLWLAMREVGYAVAQVATDLRIRLIQALMSASWSHFTSHPTGHFAAAISHEAHKASSAYSEACRVFAAFVRALVYFTVAVTISWQVAVSAIVAAVAVLVLLKRFIRMSRKAGADQVAVMKSLIARLAEALPGIKPVKAMAREQHFLPIFEREAEGLNEAQRHQVLAGETVRSFQEPILVATVALGLYFVVTFGNQPFPTVLVLSLLFYRLVGAVNEAQKRYQIMTVGESAFESILQHIENAEANREERRGGLPAPDLVEGIRFEGVSFSYGDRSVLRDVSFDVPSGTFTAFVGPSGSGKTTIVDLMVGLHQPVSGAILIDGAPLSTLDLESWRTHIGYVPQEMLLFRGSIFENVSLGNEKVTRSDAERALRQADAWAFVSSHPDGLDRTVGEGGTMLSGGQRQRIAIARALVGSPRLLVLDEATTALDPNTEREICATLRKLAGEVTIVSVSHQPALREAADQVFEVEDGRVTAVGTPVRA